MSAIEKKEARHALKSNDIFNILDSDEIEVLSGFVQVLDFPEEAQIIKQGHSVEGWVTMRGSGWPFDWG